jgi:hypothetical protein
MNIENALKMPWETHLKKIMRVGKNFCLFFSCLDVDEV